MTFSPEFFLQLIIAVGTGIGVYAGIKADLAETHEKARNAQRVADKAHVRIDNLMQRD